MERICGVGTGECLRDRLLAMVGEQPGHGYDLCDRLGCMAGRTVAPGSADTVAVYRALRAMERDGLVSSRWDEPVAGPARRIYSICA